MNERFFAKLAQNPKLAQGAILALLSVLMDTLTQFHCSALQNPRFTQAIDEMQRDPKAALVKYHKDDAVSMMLKDFMEFLGGHFEEVSVEKTASYTTRLLTGGFA